jgi:hypothetical protein
MVNMCVDLDRLIENIFVYPSEAEWTVELIKSVALNYGIEKSKIIKSDLYENPLQ